jgi:predicted helicase
VQILDPATGTGTFLNETILHIKESFAGQEGRWKNYVNEDLLPRLHGFELMMASYTIAHLKLSSTIKESGVELDGKKRLGVYLNNSLEKGEERQKTLFDFGFGKAITEESNQANKVKSELPIMVVLGNPPYSISSQNKGEYIRDLIKEYKKDLNERKINLDDDYIKFIRFSEDLIEKNGEGIIGMITNNSFIDGITHRQMRKHLLETFDKIYILNLHGDSKKKEKAPDGGKDENVFNIMQGVSISLFIKTGKKKNGLADVHHAELYGKQKDKFENLNKTKLENVKWQKLEYKEPYYFFVPKDFGEQAGYDKNFLLTDLFDIYSAGIKTKVDNISIDFNKKTLSTRVEDILTHKYSLNEVIQKFDLNPKTTWEYDNVLKIDYAEHCLTSYDYRPLDQRYVYYDKNFLSRSRSLVMDNFFDKENVGIETSRVGDYIFISKNISDEHFISDNSFKFPLYIYSKNGSRISNLKKEIVAEIEKVVGKTEPEDILDYIYAILYSPSYREKYKEFLKIDFPRVPYPADKNKFIKLVELGRELRGIHLLESPKLNNFITTYQEAGSDIIEKKYLKYKDSKVYINETQYFGGVPEIAWNFYIGGYQPAQKWLKDRQGRKLTNTDIEHYQKIVIALAETDRIMKEIDKINY